MNIVIGILVISFIVIIHELGHFLLAKRAGIRVEEFCLGLGPRILSKKFGETVYAIRLFPIGGACIMTGEDEEVENDDRSFGSKTVWQRISVTAAGPIFNFILAFVVSLFLIGVNGVDKPVISDVQKASASEKAGIVKGDKIISINGRGVTFFKDIGLKLISNKGEPIKVGYERDGIESVVNVTPTMQNGRAILGIVSTPREKVGFLSTIGYSASEVRYWVESVFVTLKNLFTGNISTKALAGPIGIVNMVGDSVGQSSANGALAVLSAVAFFTILISANLGVMNLLPIPALDGGRLLFLFVELIRGKRLNQKVEGYVNMGGFLLLMGLMVFLFYNDIAKIITG